MTDDDAPGRVRASPLASIRPVEVGEWPIVAWLYQVFRHDLALVVRGLPYADGRYAHRPLDAYPSPDHHGYLAWRDHPNTSEPAPIAFALVERLAPSRWSLAAFWVSPVVRRDGVGSRLALETITRHQGTWEIALHTRTPGPGRSGTGWPTRRSARGAGASAVSRSRTAPTWRPTTSSWATRLRAEVADRAGRGGATPAHSPGRTKRWGNPITYRPGRASSSRGREVASG